MQLRVAAGLDKFASMGANDKTCRMYTVSVSLDNIA